MTLRTLFLTALFALGCAGGGPSVDVAMSGRADLMMRCDRGEAPACATLGFNLVLGTDGPKNKKAAVAPLWKACQAQTANACTMLGTLSLEEGLAAPAGETAMSLYTRACELDSPSGCNGLGLLLADKNPSSPEAVAAFEKACTLESANGCFSLAMLVGSGRGTELNEARGMELLEKSCDLDNGRACHTLATAAQGTDPERATELAKKACALGITEACG